MGIRNVELKHECCPEHFLMRTAGMKEDKDTVVECMKRRMNTEISTTSTKEIRSDGQTIARADLSLGSLLPEAVDETNLTLHL